jgi:putative flavoprotein involved in K+ transport
VRQYSEEGRYIVYAGGSRIIATNLVIATGPFQRPFVPQTKVSAPDDVVQVHSSSYRNPDQLPPGAVLIVGAGSSGCQIADELSECGRQVYLSVGQHRRVPRRYRGRDYVWWRWKMGGWDRKVDSLSSPRERYVPAPLLTGVRGGYDVDLRRMASKGMILLGRFAQLAEGRLTIAPDVRDNITKGDEWFSEFKRSVDDYIVKTGMSCEPDLQAHAELRDPKEITHPILRLDLKAAGINSIVWSSGFRYQFDWVKLPVIDEAGEPIHTRGVTCARGCYFLGLQWLYKLKSAFLSLGGPEEDAMYLAERIAARRN